MLWFLSCVANIINKTTSFLSSHQTIEKMTVDRMKKRHGNINNEILMEKRVSKYTLSRVSILFIVTTLMLT